MAENNKIYITANELAEMLGVSVGHAYKLIRKLNQELEKEGFLVIAGKVPRRYFEKRWYGGCNILGSGRRNFWVPWTERCRKINDYSVNVWIDKV